jgi:hypothetical protein
LYFFANLSKDNNDTPKPIFTGSLPWLYSGSFGGAEGNNISNNIAGNYFENISRYQISIREDSREELLLTKNDHIIRES